MKLEEYLQALKDCPDKIVKGVNIGGQPCWKLSFQYGISYNWAILLKYDFNKFLKFLDDKWSCEEEFDGRRIIMNYKPGTIVMQVFNYLPSTTGAWCPNENQKKDAERQIRDFNGCLMLHPFQEKKMEGRNWARAMAIVIDEIGQHILKEKIPACFKDTRPLKSKYDDCSHIIYYP